jgi:hypothetical protein
MGPHNNPNTGSSGPLPSTRSPFPNFPAPDAPLPSRRSSQPAHGPRDALKVSVTGDRLHIGNVAITFHRTLRIPDDGSHYYLPPSLGAFPLRRVDDYEDRVPASWREHGGVFLPMFQREAMWLRFDAAYWRPNALKVAIGMVNALSGKRWSEQLVRGGREGDEQDYMVVPDQPWLDGINAGDGFVKQFCAMPLGMGYTVEGQLTGKEEFGGLQLCVFEPKAGTFPDAPPAICRRGRMASGDGPYEMNAGYVASAVPVAAIARASALLEASFAGQEMGLAAGGRMKQSIYPDSYGIDTWDQNKSARVYVHLVNSQMWTAITGEPMPSTPVTAQAYAEDGLPWFDLYDEHKGDIGPSKTLEGVNSVKEIDDEKGFTPQQDDSSVHVPDHLVHKYQPVESGVTADRTTVRNGNW